MFFQKIFKNKKATSVLATIFLISILFLTLFLISQSAEAACMVDGDECSSPGSNSECCSLYCLSTHVCDSTDVGYYGGSYNSCINLYASGSTAVVCDDIVASGAFSADGICMPNGNCDTNEACFDGSAFRADCQYCTNAGAHQCDYDVAGSGWEPDGVCVESNNCGTGAVCVSGGYYYESLSSCANKSSCDKDVNSGGFSSDGIICSSSCVGSASSNCCSTSDCGVNQVCTNYTCVSSCTCSSGDCCDGCNYRLNSYQPAGTCRECTGSSATSILQASNEDRWGQCTTGSPGSATSCQSPNCSGGSAACGYLTAGTLCRADAGACDVADYCSGSSADCPDNKEPNATDCGDCWYCQSGSCVKVNSAAYDGGDDPNGDCGVTGCYTGDCGVNTGACAYYPSGQRACGTCKECNSSGVCTNIAAGTDPYTNCSTCKYCDGSGNCINVIDTLTPENLDPKGNCNPTGCYTGDCKNDMGYCAYYTTGQQNCASCKECNSSGVCVSVTNSTDPYTDCGTCRYCQNGACENVSVSYTPANLDPLNNCGTNGCFTGDCLSSAGYCAYYGDNLQHNCLYGSICVSGECTVISSAEIKANETRMYAKTLDLNITESMVVGTIMPYAKNQVQVLGSETGSVIISGDLTLGPNAYLIFGDKVEIQPGGHLTLSGGAIVRAGSEIVSGPFGSDNPENAGVGRRACICVNDTSTYNTSYAAGAYGFLPEITGEDLCVPVSDANCGVNPRDGTLAANTIRAFDSEFWLWNSAKIDWNGNLFAWNPDIWYNDTHTATDPVCDVNYVDHYRYKLLSTASIDCDPYYWHTSFCTEDYNWSAGYWCMLPKKPGYSATFEEWTKP